ncbi:hypothetical protein [Bacillus sp. B1-b2]|nr:hypothetical protein [Bacillus sp. B1-b2]
MEKRKSSIGAFELEEKGMEEVTAQVMDVYNDGAIDSVYLKEKEAE